MGSPKGRGSTYFKLGQGGIQRFPGGSKLSLRPEAW
jgi:hypothetical protein